MAILTALLELLQSQVFVAFWDALLALLGIGGAA